MPSMPYHVEKAPTLSVLESFADDDQQLVNAVSRLRAGDPLTETGFLDSVTLDHAPYPTLQARIAYLNEQWLGMTQDSSGDWVPQRPYGWGNWTTGGWARWYGDADTILRETFICAGEIALGVDHNDPLPDPPVLGRRPIQVLWKCSQEWFEGWVTWTPQIVTVILATPGTGAMVWTDPDPYSPNSGPPDFGRDPSSYPPNYGMLVVSHEHNPRGWVIGGPSPLGQIVLPFAVWHSQGEVITVVPAERDGGVLHQRRGYQPPPGPSPQPTGP
jgi:hypothetical protein